MVKSERKKEKGVYKIKEMAVVPSSAFLPCIVAAKYNFAFFDLRASFLDHFFSGNVASDEVPGLLDQVFKQFAMMQFRKRSFLGFPMSTNLKLIAALCRTHSLPPLPLVAVRICLDY